MQSSLWETAPFFVLTSSEEYPVSVLKPVSSPKLSASEALTVMEWLHGKSGLAAKDMTKEDCGYAQALLVDMLNSSFAMGFVEALFRSGLKISGGPKKVIVAFLKGAGKNLLKYKDKDDLEKMIKKPRIYKSVFNVAKLRTKSLWAIRISIGEWP